MKRTLVLAFAICCVACAAYADPFPELTLGPAGCSPAACNGYQFTTMVVPTSASTSTVTFDVLNVSGSNAYLQSFGLSLFSSNLSSVTFGGSTPALSSITVNPNESSNNGGGGDGCASGPTGAFCVLLANGYLLTPTHDIKFTFTVTGGGALLDTWHIKALGTLNADGSGGNIFALTDDGRYSIPEPSSVALLATGFLALAGVVRRRKQS